MNTSNTPQQDDKIAPANFEQAVIQPTAFTPSDGKQSSKRLNIKPVPIMLVLLMLLGTAAVWFLFTAKSVIIKTNPQTATFEITGGLKFEIDNHYVMRQGTYQYKATHPGYYPLDVAIDVDDQQNQVREFTFRKLPGSLTVDITDDANEAVKGTVWLDGKLLGDSAVKLTDISAGEHQLVIKAPRYFDDNLTIDIIGMDDHQQILVGLKPAWADITLLSEPEGAVLKSGDQIVGATPFKGTLLQGEHELDLSLAGFKGWQTTLTVKAGDSVDLPRVYLEKSDGVLQLNSKPSFVSVTLDGKYLGLTPLAVSLTANQKHQLSLFKDGYQQQHQQINVPSGESRALTITLQPQLGQVTIHANHEDALLYIDDRLMGRANQSVTLTAKQHTVVIKKEGYVDFATTVLPRADLQQIVDARLKTLEEHRWENIKPHIRTVVVNADLKLFKPSDVFTMGASRREQGRRANETNRRIALKRPFYLGIKEINNAQFRKFVKSHTSGHVKGNSLDNNKHPVVNISWKQAALFCNWLSGKEKLPLFYTIKDDEIVGVNAQSNGYRLPTEAEWAWISRYQDGQMLKYTWGKKLPPMPNSGNFADRSSASLLGYVQATYNDKFAVTAPVASFAANPKGIYDLSGNAAEWMNDFYEVKTGLSMKIEKDPLGSQTGDYHVIRGSSWAHGSMTELRLSFRDYGADARNDVGFRIARFVDATGNE
jgi:formylglycine-generating enzyme required for sulfatase activity